MIQDIGPNVFRNDFSDRGPSGNDIMLCYREGEALMNEPERLFPEFSDMPWADSEDTEYLFSVNERGFFLYKGERFPEGFSFQPLSVFRKDSSVFSFAGITGAQLYKWHQDNRYCGRCGSGMERSERERAFVCPKCGMTVYPKISPAVIVAVNAGDELLMIRSAGRTSSSFHLVAGYVEIGETFEDTVRRELMEEVGVKVKNIRYYKSQPWSFSDAVMIGFRAELDGEKQPFRLQESEVAEARWIKRSEIPEPSNNISIGSEMINRFKYGEI
ncbi:MAG: NAD(+) diphosphatase [Clostridia bacterium]|nr:NAD(+) diphosphatase [Clostridia bacterium]